MRAIVAAFAALGGGVILAAFVVSVARGDAAEQASLYLSNCHLLYPAKCTEPGRRESGNCRFTVATNVCL
jgi:hypothetical protein